MEKNNNSKTSEKELNDSAKVTTPFRLPPEESKSTIVQKPFYIKDENSSQTPSTNKQEKKEKTLYQRLNESKFGSYLDWADLALDGLSLVPGPVGWLAGVAGTVTGIPQGLLAAHDIYKNGLNAHNFTDVMKLVPMGSLIGKSSNAGLKLMGKTNKYARRAHPYFNTAVESGINMVRRNKKYFPYFAPIWGMDAFNIGTDIAHIASNKDGGSIKIKESNKGKFTASAKAHGMGVLEFASKVLNNKEDYSPTLVKRANFARNAKKFKHEEGSKIHKPFGHRSVLDNGWLSTKELKNKKNVVPI